MRLRTVVVATLVVGALAGAAVLGVLGTVGDGGSLSEQWVSDTGRNVQSNHHAAAVGTVDGRQIVYAPVSGRPDGRGCALVAIDGSDGTTLWSDTVPRANCTIHSVADPAVADVDGDGRPEVVAATTERVVQVHDPLTGEVRDRRSLATYGYTEPVVADLAPAPGREIITVDVRGTVFVHASDGGTHWTRRLDAYVFAQPTVADFDADGATELVVAGGDGTVTVLDGNGSIEWNGSVPGEATWLATGQADDDPAVEIVVATARGALVAFDGADGTREWARQYDDLAAVKAMNDGDGDGQAEVYAVAADGVLRSLDARTGATEWTTELTTADVQMMPPPVLGDLDGDGDRELVAAGNEGQVSVVDPGDGAVLATYERDVLVYTHPTASDVDGDGDDEAVVVYADGRVVSLDYERDGNGIGPF